jgi:uncharacterized protein YndB with AHSA1/START domain
MEGDATMNIEQVKHDLVINRVIDAPIEQVWEAWVDPALVKQWWGPDGFTCPLAEIDFRIGGTSLVCMSSPEFGDQYSTWHYTNIVPGQQIEYIHNLVDKDGKKIDPASIGMPPDFPQDMLNLVVFKDLGDGRTELTITEYDWTVGHMMEMSRLGMQQCLAKMNAIFVKASTQLK